MFFSFFVFTVRLSDNETKRDKTLLYRSYIFSLLANAMDGKNIATDGNSLPEVTPRLCPSRPRAGQGVGQG